MKEELLLKIEELKNLFTQRERPTMDTGQLEAVWDKSTTTLVLAGAGTGKTTVITEKIQSLLDQGVEPDKILAITYTKKAALEMERRVQNKNISISTIHSFCFKLLRECEGKESLEEIIAKFGSGKGFDELITRAIKLLKTIQTRFEYILVDEYQDIDSDQHKLIKLLAQGHNLFVVGDDDQCLPGDSMILTKTGNKRMDTIKIGEEVATAIGKGHLSHSKVNHVNKIFKQAKLITLKTQKGYQITTTDNHKMFCFVPSSFKELKGTFKRYYYVYLMHKQELGWRLGITNDLAVRLRLERSADKLVAIKSFITREEAQYWETLLSLKYGIPTVCFQEREGIMSKRIWSERLYQDLDVQKNVSRLINDLEINLEAHQVSLEAVNRGGKVRIKINLEMCYRNYCLKHTKEIFSKNPKVSHQLSVETSHRSTLYKLEQMGFQLHKSKKGKRLRITSIDLAHLGAIAMQIQKATGGIIENQIKIGKINIQHKKAIICPASNVIEGMFLPVVTDNGIIYDQVIAREEQTQNITVYDLEIDRTHNFVANGVVVHNSIYGFRGSKLKYITKFQDYHPNSKVITLDHNYRVPSNIFKMADKVISQNKKRIPKEIKAMKKDGTVTKLSWLNEWKEAEGIIAEIKGLECPLEEVAVIYRHHKRAEVIKVLAQMHELPHSTDRKVKKGVSFLTCHSAKGLEFDAVFLLDNYKKSFTKKTMDEEEERRVQYVALTRAKERLYLSSTNC